VHALVVLALAAACFALLSQSAVAANLHVFAGSFGGEGSGSGQFKEPSGVAVNDTTHDVYVADSANNRVEELNSTGSSVIGEFTGSTAPTGVFSAPTAIAVDNSEDPLDPSSGDVYVLDQGHSVIDKFSAAGAYLGQLSEGEASSRFGTLDGVAVDAEGVVWVYQASGEIDSFSDALVNAFLAKRSSPFGTSFGFGVDAENHLYVNRGAEVVAQLNSAGTPLIEELDGEPTSAVGVDPSNNEVYVDNRTTVAAFSSAGLFIERFGAGHLAAGSGVAIDSTSHTAYVADSKADTVSVFEERLLPDVTTGAVTAQSEGGATVAGVVNPDGVAVTSCLVEYGATTAYGQTAPCVPGPGSGTEPVNVTADLTGLPLGSTPHYRLVAANANGANYGADESFIHGAAVDNESFVDVTSTGATLLAQVNPRGTDTTYRFEYGTTVAYGASVPIPPGDIGAGSTDVEVQAHLQALSPATAYHVRVAASDATGTTFGPDETFTTQPTGGKFTLPDGRGWELVSPPDKHGANLASVFGAQAASSGDAVAYPASGPTEAEPPGYGSNVQVLSVRSEKGWQTRDITPPHASAAGLGGEYAGFSEDLSDASVEPGGSFLALSPEASERTPYLRSNFPSGNPAALCAGACYRPLVTGAPGSANVPSGVRFGEEHRCEPPRGEERACGPEFLGGSPDYSHVVLRSPASLVPGAPEIPEPEQHRDSGSLYEWSEGHLTLVSVLPDGEPATPGGLKLHLGGLTAGENDHASQAISTDGSSVVWTDGRGEGTTTHLYLRYNATDAQSAVDASAQCSEPSAACTLQLDRVQGGSGEGEPSPHFQRASIDDSRIFFTDSQRLTADSGGAFHNPDLYECDIVKNLAGGRECELTDLTPQPATGSAGVAGAVLGVSEDGSSVYFAAGGSLTGGQQNPRHEMAVLGTCGREGALGDPTCNLYRAHDGVVTFIAVLSAHDLDAWGSLNGESRRQRARVSPDGEWLVFMSVRSLTGYNNRDAATGQPDTEVYLYNPAAGVVCASCNPTGARPHGTGATSQGLVLLENGAGRWAASIEFGVNETGAYQTRNLSDEGRLFFNADDALVPLDTNANEDVYQYEPAGVGGCTEATSTGSAQYAPASHGCIALVSSGGSNRESAFFDASRSGDDVFFLTAAKLSPRDLDTSYDLYDARVGGGEPEAAPIPACEGDACQSPAQPPADVTPGSLTFSGPGNTPFSSAVPVAPRTAVQLRAQRLAKALKACRKLKASKRRAKCNRTARKRYGASKKATAKRAGHDRRASS
jgi:DNA-binding beta-propeller fold protein YncE